MRLDKRQLQPLRYDGLVRVGPPNDGGYVAALSALRNATLLLSLGVSDDWRFDRACLEIQPGLRVIGVDHTIGPRMFLKRLAQSLVKVPAYALMGSQRVRHHRRRIGIAIDYFRLFRAPHRHVRKRVSADHSNDTITLTELIRTYGAVPARDFDVFLKMDIEGAEYEIIDDILAHASRIGCIAAEFHGLDTRTAEFNEAMGRLLHDFCIVHIHGNNHSVYDLAIDFPAILEITFVHRRLMEPGARPSGLAYPRPDLDGPNDPGRPAYALNIDQD